MAVKLQTVETERVATCKQWAETIRDEGRKLTPWELDFAESIINQIDEYGGLSDRQAEILERIYTVKTP